MTHRRRNFPNSVKRDANNRSNGICECHLLAKAGVPGFSVEGCGVRLTTGHTRYEHINPDTLFGLNDLDNCAVLTTTCWRIKTDTYDLPKIAKARRQADRHMGIRRSHRPMPGSRESGIKKPFSGPPIDRNTGQAWRSGR